ncbi:hypothetical protein T01_14714 [Trichinella spiralis]|uniref:Uncharacterized protein n=1 Tax=Trichinella spiralis TaxID=6334 RepID=A0A0V1BLQ2_TRISP|nr:hypothetical protein T01_14714 [Trichinella spiralis]
MNDALFCALRKFQKSLLCNSATVVPCTSEKEHTILVQFETWKLIFVEKKGGNRAVDSISLAINKYLLSRIYLTSGAVREHLKLKKLFKYPPFSSPA